MSGYVNYNFDSSNDAPREAYLSLEAGDGASIDVDIDLFTEKTGPNSFKITIEQGVVVLPPGNTLTGGAIDLWVRDIDCQCDPNNELQNISITTPNLIGGGFAQVHNPGDASFDDNAPAGGTDIQIVGIDVVDFLSNDVVIEFDCVPEPTSAALLLLAGVPALIRRRKA
jgi:hypothetical protein